MLSKPDAKNLIDKVISFSKLPECEVYVGYNEEVFIRFANNGITTSGYRVTQQISITSVTADKRGGNSSVSEFSDEALRRAVETAEQLARISHVDPEHVDPLGPQNYPVIQNFDDGTASAGGDALIPHVKGVIDAAQASQLTTAGFITRSASASAVGNKQGLFGYHTSTDSSLSNTMRNSGGSSSGWSSQSSSQIRDLNGEAAAKVSVEKCLRGAHAHKKIDPGKYTVILEPAATADIIGYLTFGMDARSAEQGQSFLSKKADKVGETHVGEKMFPEFITIRSDPFNTKLAASPWAGSLLPNQKIDWIDRGVVKNMYWDRYWAQKAGKQPTPDPSNLVLDGQYHTLADLITSADRALLITRLWYIRVLQPQTLQVTGTTRDGVFLIENGKVTEPVTNFRWNESPVRIFQNAKMLTQPARVDGSEVGSVFAPAMLVADFPFSSVSDAV
jgi:predicted Zn-dependent protease